MAEKLFIISEVKPAYEDRIVRQGEYNQYTLADGRGVLWLPDDAVIPASRLRYGNPRTGQRYFHASTHSDSISGRAHGFCIADSSWGDGKAPDYRLLLLDPPAPVDDWEKWVDAVPGREEGMLLGHDRETFKAWLRRMPRGKRDL